MREITYLKTEGGHSVTVKYERAESGHELFWEHDLGREEWKLHVASEEELDTAREILREAEKEDGAVELYHEHGTLTIKWVR